MSEALKNEIHAYFGALKTTTTAPVSQWAYGQKLIVHDADLPSVFEAYYSNSRSRGEAKPQIGTDGEAPVPDEYFLSGADIYVFLMEHEGADDGRYRKIVHIPIDPCSQPSDVEPTPVQQNVIDQAIAALNTAVEQCEAYVEHYPTVINGEWYVWDEAQQTFVSTGVPATGNGIADARLNNDYTLTLIFTDGSSFTTPISIRGEKGDPGEPGAKGDPGVKGDPGATGNGIASIAKTGTSGLVDTYTITFTDGTTTTFEVTNGRDGHVDNVDPTLSVSGFAADAKVTGDALEELSDAVYYDKTVSMANTNDNVGATANAEWGFYLPNVSTEQVTITPKFNVTSGTYTAKRWRSADAAFPENTELTLLETKTASMGESVAFDDYTPYDFITFLSSVTTDKLRCYNGSQTPAYNVPLGRKHIQDGTGKNIYRSGNAWFTADQLDIVVKASEIDRKQNKNVGAENAGKQLVVDASGNIAVGSAPIQLDTTLKDEGKAAESKTVGDILLGLPIGPDIEWNKGYTIDANGNVVANSNAAVTADFISDENLRYLYIDAVNYPETPGYLSVYVAIHTYQSDGTYVGYQQMAYSRVATWGTMVRLLKPDYKYKIALSISNRGVFSDDEIISMLNYHWKVTDADITGLVDRVERLETETERIDQLEKDVNGGGTELTFYIEKGGISTQTGEDTAATDSTVRGRSVGYYAGGSDNVVISVPVGGRCLVFEYAGETASDFIRTISPSQTDGITYVSSPYTLETEEGKYYRFEFSLNNSYMWQDGQEYFKDFTFIEQSTYTTGLKDRVSALEQQSGSDKLFTGKTCVTLGDSITYRNVWQPVVNDALGMTMVNKGIGSTTLTGGDTDNTAMSSDSRLNGVLNENPDYVTILGGANDLADDAPIGSEVEFDAALADKDRTTFLGAYSYIVEYLLGHDPTLDIMILGTTWAHNDGKRYSETMTYTMYSDASQKVAQHYGLPFVDLHGESGFNAFTMGSAVANQIYSSDQIHPNAAGGKRIATLVIAKMIEAWKYTI